MIAQWTAVDERDPLPSIDDTCAAIGIEPQRSKPGDRFAVDVELVMYWPAISGYADRMNTDHGCDYPARRPSPARSEGPGR